MESPQINVGIDQLTFSLFQRPLHPELFQIYASRQLKTEKYEALIWVTGCTHVVSVFAGDVCLSEVVSTPGQLLPHRGLVERFQFRGPRTHKCTLSRGVSYMTDFQIEKMSANLYRQSHTDLEKFRPQSGRVREIPRARSGQPPAVLLHRFRGPADGAAHPHVCRLSRPGDDGQDAVAVRLPVSEFKCEVCEFEVERSCFQLDTCDFELPEMPARRPALTATLIRLHLHVLLEDVQLVADLHGHAAVRKIPHDLLTDLQGARPAACRRPPGRTARPGCAASCGRRPWPPPAGPGPRSGVRYMSSSRRISRLRSVSCWVTASSQAASRIRLRSSFRRPAAGAGPWLLRVWDGARIKDSICRLALTHWQRVEQLLDLRDRLVDALILGRIAVLVHLPAQLFGQQAVLGVVLDLIDDLVGSVEVLLLEPSNTASRKDRFPRRETRWPWPPR